MTVQGGRVTSERAAVETSDPFPTCHGMLFDIPADPSDMSWGTFTIPCLLRAGHSEPHAHIDVDGYLWRWVS